MNSKRRINDQARKRRRIAHTSESLPKNEVICSGTAINENSTDNLPDTFVVSPLNFESFVSATDVSHPDDLEHQINCSSATKLCLNTVEYEQQPITYQNNDDDQHSIPNNVLYKQKLREWAISYNIELNAISHLLRIERQYGGHPELPADARTLLCTPRNMTITKIDAVDSCTIMIFYNRGTFV